MRHSVTPRLRLCGWLSVLLMACVCPAAQETSPLPAGQIVEKVICLADASESYALYLPSDYTADQSWPVIFAFDPGARGRIPVERFQAGAERFGFVVLGSNTSRNFDPQTGLKSITAMWADANTRYRLAPGRAYTAGFSGGARLATALAVRSPDFAGVIACGATFDKNNPPESGRPGVMFCTAGNADGNFSEVMLAPATLAGLGIPNRAEIFDGAHEWAPAEVFSNALGWLEIQAIRNGARPRNPDFWEQYTRQIQTLAETAEREGDLPEACRLYGWLRDDLSGRPGAAPFAGKEKELARLAEVKQARREDEELLRREDRLILRFDQRVSDIRARALDFKAVEKQLDWWRREIGALAETRQSTSRESERRMIGRVLDKVGMWGFEGPIVAFQTKQYGQAALFGEIGRLVHPGSAHILYNLACAYSRLGQPEQALAALQAAVEKGFKNLKQLKSDEDLSCLRDLDGFLRICRQIESNP